MITVARSLSDFIRLLVHVWVLRPSRVSYTACMGRRAAETSTDEHLDYIATLLDDMFRVPGTQIRFGLDFLIGWIPGVGDAVAGVASLVIIISAWRRGA